MMLTRTELLIDILDLKAQKALLLPDVTGRQLIRQILDEYAERRYLSDEVGDYRLTKDGRPLDLSRPLSEQTENGSFIRFEERPVDTPLGAYPTPVLAYLKELDSGDLYRVRWVPGLIGRYDGQKVDNPLMVADMQSHPAGLRVSRRHARFIDRNERLVLESTSDNGTMIKKADGREIAIPNGEFLELEDGDVIVLTRSNIAFRYMTRPA